MQALEVTGARAREAERERERESERGYGREGKREASSTLPANFLRGDWSAESIHKPKRQQTARNPNTFKHCTPEKEAYQHTHTHKPPNKS